MKTLDAGSWRQAAVRLADAIALDRDEALRVVTYLVAEGFLARSRGRSIVKPDIQGLAFLTVALIGRSLGLPLRRTAAFAHGNEQFQEVLLPPRGVFDDVRTTVSFGVITAEFFVPGGIRKLIADLANGVSNEDV
jgi:hypothetical protein